MFSISATCVRCTKSALVTLKCIESSLHRQSVSHKWTFQRMASQSIVHDKKLFTPGPLGTSLTVKEAMLIDLGSRDILFVNTVKYIREKLVQIAGLSTDAYTCVPIQGSGTFAVEAVLQTIAPRQNAKVLVCANGAYGKRLAKICDVTNIAYRVEHFPEDSKVNPSRVENIIKKDRSFTCVAIVHCETSSGVINPVEEIGACVQQYLPKASFFVDAMSSFGAVPLDMTAGRVDYMVSSANKCLQGVPGFSYVIANIDKLNRCKGQSRSLSLDVQDQYEVLEKTGQFRFTPATHSMLAFKQALHEFEEEGGLKGRANRYKENRRILREGMKELGFKELLDDSHDGYIITSFHFPSEEKFDFMTFYNKLNKKAKFRPLVHLFDSSFTRNHGFPESQFKANYTDQVIYPGKVIEADCFRIGSIGHINPDDMRHLLKCVREVCIEMGLSLPLSQ